MTKDMTPLLGYRLKLAQHALHRRLAHQREGGIGMRRQRQQPD